MSVIKPFIIKTRQGSSVVTHHSCTVGRHKVRRGRTDGVLMVVVLRSEKKSFCQPIFKYVTRGQDFEEKNCPEASNNFMSP